MIFAVTQGTGPFGLLVEATITEHFISATYKSFNRLTPPVEPYIILLSNHDFFLILHHTTIIRREHICLKSYKQKKEYHKSMG